MAAFWPLQKTKSHNNRPAKVALVYCKMCEMARALQGVIGVGKWGRFTLSFCKEWSAHFFV